MKALPMDEFTTRALEALRDGPKTSKELAVATETPSYAIVSRMGGLVCRGVVTFDTGRHDCGRSRSGKALGVRRVRVWRLAKPPAAV